MFALCKQNRKGLALASIWVVILRLKRFSFPSCMQVLVFTAPLSGSSTTGTTAGQQQFGLWGFCCMTWCVETSRLSKMKKLCVVKCSSGAGSRQVRVTHLCFYALCVFTLGNMVLVKERKCNYGPIIHFPTECQQLIKWCLSLRPAERPSFEDIINHSWMQNTPAPSTDSTEIRLHSLSHEAVTVCK